MNASTLGRAMSASSYPGRGIVLGLHEDGQTAVIAYFIMGRSVNSRNRVFVSDGDGIRTQAHDPKKLTDPSLVIYAPIRRLNDQWIVTNGDQTDTIYDHLAAGSSFESALRSRTFEPDAPNYTPRISGLLAREFGRFQYALSILKAAPNHPDCCLRQFFEYEPVAGVGHFLHTYQGDGDPLPSFKGEPEPVRLSGSLEDMGAEIWDHLNADNRVSLIVRLIDASTGSANSRIINRY